MRRVSVQMPALRVVRGRLTGDVSPRARGAPWAAWSRAWLGVVVLAFVNGVLHRGYEGALGGLRAEQVSNVVLVVLLAPWVVRTEQRHHLSTAADAVAVGAAWASATVAFEFLFGRYVNGDVWAELLRAYNLSEGHIWLLTVAGIALAPLAARAWRLRKQPLRDGD